MKKIQKMLTACLALLLLLTGCVNNEKSNDKKEKVVPEQIKGMRVRAELLTKEIVYDSEGKITLDYDVTVSDTTGFIRLYFLVEGYLNEFSLNGSDMSMYHDHDIGEDMQISVSFYPELNGFDKGDDVDVSLYMVSMDPSLEFEDNLYTYYLSHTVGIIPRFTLDTYSESDIQFINPEKFVKVSSDLKGENRNIESLIEAVSTKSELMICEADEYPHRVGMDGFKYEKDKQYYLTKIGTGDLMIYPLINGELIYDNEEILAYYYPETVDDILYTPFSIGKYGVVAGDKITFLIWTKGSDVQKGDYGLIALD